jgi:hypothetical protein
MSPRDQELWLFRGGVWKRRGVPDLPPYSPPAPPPSDPPPTGGGGGTPTTPPSTAVTPELPFEFTPAMRKAMSDSPRKAFAHYFYTFPLAPANGEDWWKTHWLPKGGTLGGTGAKMSATEITYGGETRDRPMPIPALNRAAGFEVADKVVEVKQARAAGFDGFMPDVLQVGAGKQRWTQHVELMDAIARVNDPTFKLVPMVDSLASASSDQTLLADHMDITFNHASSFVMPDGSKVLAAYAPERAPANTSTWNAAGWKVVLDRLRTVHGHKVLFNACFLESWTSANCAQDFQDIAWMMSRWGDRDPNQSGANTVQNRLAPQTAHTAGWANNRLAAGTGVKWMHPVSVGDSRPNQSNFYENLGWKQLQASWLATIDGGADWVQVPTWSDYAEHAHIGVSANHGWALLDVNLYFMARWKLGYYPTIVRDAVYLQHRIHPPTGVTYTGTGQTKWQTIRANTTPLANIVSVAVFLTAPATVNVTAGGVTTTPTTANPAPAGFSIHEVPLRTGTIRAEVVRGGTAVAVGVSPYAVSATQVTDDYNYRGYSSLRPALTNASTTPA